MPLTVYVPTTPEFPTRVGSAVVYVRESLDQGDWQLEPDLEFVRGSAAAEGHDLGRAEFRRRYGRRKGPQDADLATLEATRLDGWWVQVRLATQDGALAVLWTGRIENQTHELMGRDVRDPADQPVYTGEQTFVAYEPRQVLRKISLHESVWLERESGAVADVLLGLRAGWIPDMNGRDTRRMLVGNRSGRPTVPSIADNREFPTGASDVDGSYLYGGTDLWSRFDYARYILNRFVNRRDPNTGDWIGGVWRLAGQADLLKGMTDHLPLGDVETVDDLLRALIPTRLGVDFYIRIVERDGQTVFEVFVYALLAEEEGFGTATLPANPNRVEFKTRRAEVSARLVRSNDQSFDVIRIVGARAVLCCTLEAQPVAAEGSGQTLDKRWTDALEREYKTAVGGEDIGELNDRLRALPRYKAVYQAFGLKDGARLPVPKLLSDGTVVADRDLLAEQRPDQQTTVRSTLGWLPLRSGFDYTPAELPDDYNPSGSEPDFLAPLVLLWAQNDPEETDNGNTPPAGQWIQADRAPQAIGVSALPHDWGVLINCTPNHLLGKGRFDNAAFGGQATDSIHAPIYNPGRILATIAMPIDQRLVLEYRLADIDGSVMTLEMPDAEVWHVADKTVFGIDATGQPLRSGPKTLRNDAERMYLVMAGALARYTNERVRAEIVIEGYSPAAGLLGQIMTRVEEAGEFYDLGAPITSVSWENGDGGRPRTVIRTGYAR